MRTIAHLLRTADPLVDEPIWSPHERLIVRQIVLEHSRMAKPSNAWSRRPFVVTLATLCLVLLAGVTIVPRIWSPAVQAAVRFEVRLAELSPGPGLQQVSVPTPSGTIYLHQEVIATNIDIRSARVVPANSPSTFNVEITFSPSGAENMSRATREHVGRPLAILLDGKVVMAPTLRSTISTLAVITGDYTRAEADRIASGMIGR